MDRRKFITVLAGYGVAGLSGTASGCSQWEEKDKPGRADPHEVVCLKRADAIGSKKPLSSKTAAALIKDLIKGLGPENRLDKIFKSRDRVGIKVNCLAGRGLSTSPELVYALTDELKACGVSPSNIIIFERTGRELKKAGYKLNKANGVKVLGNDDPQNRYDRSPVIFKSIGSCFCRILTSRIDKLINFGVLKDHDLAGISVGLKNLYGLIHNPNKYHDNHCSPYVAHVAASPPVRDKLCLTICDGLVAQYQGGPALKKSCTWKAGILLASLDPVALDAVGADIIEKKRKSIGMNSLAEAGRPILFLEEARRLGLGEDRLDRIKVVNV